MTYQTDNLSRARAIDIYGAVICVANVLGFLARAGVITDHILW